MAPDMGLDAASLQMSKETRSFLWEAGMVPYVSVSPLTDAQPENPGAESESEDNSSDQAGSSTAYTSFDSNRTSSRGSRPSASHTSSRTSSRSAAWDILSGSGPTSYAGAASSGSRSGFEGSRSRFVRNSGAKRPGASAGPKKATSTYESVRKSMQARPAVRSKGSPILILALVIAITVLITTGTFFFVRKAVSGPDGIPVDPTVFVGGDKDEKPNTGSSIPADCGYDYSDFRKKFLRH